MPSAFAVQKGLLDAVRGRLPAGARVVLRVGRFYGTPDLIRWCQNQGWDCRLRLKGSLTTRSDRTRRRRASSQPPTPIVSGMSR